MARILLVAIFFAITAWTQCISISDAPQHIGKKQCVAGKVLKVTQTENGSYWLNFCADAAPCPFAVVVLPMDLEDVGDVRQLAGKEIEIHGKIKSRKGTAEIVLTDADQLRGGSVKLPPIPQTYDVERHGNFSPGQFKGNKTTKRSHKRPPALPSEEIDTE